MNEEKINLNFKKKSQKLTNRISIENFKTQNNFFPTYRLKYRDLNLITVKYSTHSI